jgi:hypothetical protein
MRRRVSRTFSFITVVILLARIVPAANQIVKFDQDATFHIAAGSLESALIEFSRQAALQVVVGAPVANISVEGVEGRRHPREVLISLLNDTGLTFTVIGDTITIHALPSE